MKLFWRFFVVLISGALISSCFNPPEYPIIPEINFDAVSFVDVKDPSPFQVAADSLILKLKFKDGDGDLGIGSNESFPPHNDRWYFLTSDLNADAALKDDCHSYNKKCWYMKLAEVSKYVSYKLRKKPGGDTLKAFVKPYNCTRWDVVRDKDQKVIDTVYFYLNPHYNNIFVEFQTKNNDGTFSVFNWSDFLTYPSCEVQGFNGRFPILNDRSAPETPLEGLIRYSMPSPFFKVIFGAKTLRMKVYIEDRALNKSNEIVTPEFTLQ